MVLTVLLNLAVRAFPETARRVARSLTTFTSRAHDAPTSDQSVRVFTPWKAMVIGSLILTLVVNVVLWIR